MFVFNGDARVARAALRGVDHHGERVEHHAGRDDAEIGHGVFVRVRRGTGQAQDRLGKHEGRRADDGGEPQRDEDGLHEHAVRLLRVVLAAAARHKRGDRHIQREKHREADELRLRGEAHGRDGRPCPAR